MSDLQDLQDTIGVQFDDIELLKKALTHRSVVNESNLTMLDTNERMEYLGDAILDFIVADMLYHAFPDVSEGNLTQLRSAMVKTETLAILARECDFGPHLNLGRGEENSGGRERSTILGSSFEAVIGAIYLDKGLGIVIKFLLPRLSNLLQYIIEYSLHLDARSELQEWSQAEFSITPKYRTIESNGPEHDQQYMVQVVIGDEIIAQGAGKGKRAAAQSAARAALQKLKIEGWQYEPPSFFDSDFEQVITEEKKPPTPEDKNDSRMKRKSSSKEQKWKPRRPKQSTKRDE